MNEELANVLKWCKANKLSLNPTKSNYFVITPKLIDNIGENSHNGRYSKGQISVDMRIPPIFCCVCLQHNLHQLSLDLVKTSKFYRNLFNKIFHDLPILLLISFISSFHFLLSSVSLFR